MRLPARILLLILAPTLLLAACGSDDGDDAAAAPAPTAGADGRWAFTDDRGEEVALDHAPERIVAYHNAAAALLPLGVRPVGVFGGSSPAASPLLTGLDLEGIESVGDVYGELNFEKLASLRPDLIVTLYDPAQAGPVFGFLENAQDLAEDIAPVIALDGTADPVVAIERFEDLVASMGVDVDTPEIEEDRADFEAARDGLRAAVAEQPGLVLLGNNAGAMTAAQIKDVPTVAAHPAVAADQIVPWQVLDRYSYDSFTDQLEELTAAVRAADPTVAP